MAGIITIAPGHDASYPWRQIGTATGVVPSRKAGAAYYLSPVEREVSHRGTGTATGSRNWASGMGKSSTGRYSSGYTANSLIPGIPSEKHVWGACRSDSALWE